MISKIGKALRSNILVGMVLVTPLVITLYIVNLLFSFITGNALFLALVKVLPASLRGDSDAEQIVAKVLAFIIVLMILFLLGFFVRSLFGKQLYRLGELILERIPVINKIYIWVRQISEAFLAQRQTLFKEVVLVEYPRKGLYSVAFVTAPVAPEFDAILRTEENPSHVSLFIPTTPNPTSGLMIIASRDDLEELPITVADAMKLIVSAGAVYPGTGLVDDRPTFLDKLETWISKDSSRAESTPP